MKLFPNILVRHDSYISWLAELGTDNCRDNLAMLQIVTCCLVLLQYISYLRCSSSVSETEALTFLGFFWPVTESLIRCRFVAMLKTCRVPSSRGLSLPRTAVLQMPKLGTALSTNGAKMVSRIGNISQICKLINLQKYIGKCLTSTQTR